MAKFAATDYNITINGTSYSTYLMSAELTIESDDVETTGMQDGWRTRVGGLRQASVSLEFFQDFDNNTVDSRLFPLFNTLATVAIRPTSAAIGANNAAYTAVCLVNQYQPFASSVGDVATFSVSWPVTGTVTRATA